MVEAHVDRSGEDAEWVRNTADISFLLIEAKKFSGSRELPHFPQVSLACRVIQL